jgi:hypothetical protein
VQSRTQQQNPRDTVSRARPFTSAHTPISVEAFLARSASKRSGQSFFLPRRGQALFLESAFEQFRRFNDISFSGPSQFVHIVQMIEPANAAFIGPVKPYKRHSCGDHLIPMAIQGSVNEDIARGGVYTAVISRFLEGAGQHNCRIGA